MAGTIPDRPAARRGPPWLVIAVTALALLLGGAAVTLILVSGRLFRDRIIEEARLRGVELGFEDANVWWTSVSLEGVTFKLIGVPGLTGRVGTIDVTVDGWTPKRIVAGDVHVDLVGSAADLVLAASEWAKNHPQAYVVPVSADPVGATWASAPGEAPWLVVEKGGLTDHAGTVAFSAANARVSGVDTGVIEAAWTAAAATVSMALGARDPAKAPLTIVVAHAATPKTARITLAPVGLERLAAPWGVPFDVRGVTASGKVDLVFPLATTTQVGTIAVPDFSSGPVVGTLESRLDGWVPPHPVELDGFLFGGVTTFTSSLAVNAARTAIVLSNSRVRAGAFELAGGGQIDRAPDHALVRMDLSGNLACSAVAQSAAAAHVGSFLATMIGDAARQVVDGSVGVRVRITADSRNLAAARVEPAIGVGCGLKPIGLLDPKTLARLPQELRDFATAAPGLIAAAGGPSLPALPSSLPPLPTALPKLPTAFPSLPSAFPFPVPRAPAETPARKAGK